MYDITHLLDRHRKDMAALESEQKRNQRQRESKLRALEKLTRQAMRLNQEHSDRELDRDVI